MYAVISTGGKQYRVAEGERVDIERLRGRSGGDEVDFEPVLVVDDADVLSTPAQLTGASVSARVVENGRGPKINGLTYKSKTRNRRRWGHRQATSTIEITGITRG